VFGFLLNFSFCFTWFFRFFDFFLVFLGVVLLEMNWCAAGCGLLVFQALAVLLQGLRAVLAFNRH